MAMLASGAALRVFDTIDSTSSEAKRLAAAGETGPCWIIAGRQTGGYGRRGSAWRQSEGDVAASFLFATEAAPDVVGQLSYVLAIAVSAALRTFVSRGTDVALKWPNDVLLDGGKIAGLLLELVSTPTNARMIVAGVGVNVVSKPEIAEYQTARLVDAVAQDPPSPRQFVETLDAEFAAWRALWVREGFEPIRDAWLENAVGIGEPAIARLPDRECSGRIIGLDETGALLLETRDGVEVIAAGAVMFPRRS